MATPTSAQQWKKASVGQELELPSGNVCLVKRPGMVQLLGEGVFPDNLIGLVQKAIEQGEGKKPQDRQPKKKTAKKTSAKKTPEETGDEAGEQFMSEVLEDPDKLRSMFEAVDKITALVVVEPRVRLHTYTDKDLEDHEIPGGYKVGDSIPPHLRRDDILYTDDVDENDKMFIFNFSIGGSTDLTSFREATSSVGDVSTGEDVVDAPERPSGS